MHLMSALLSPVMPGERFGRSTQLTFDKKDLNLMKDQLYKKEIWITIVFSLLLILFGHFATLFVLFPSLKGGLLWGFPVEYIVPILMGWFGLMAVCIAMAVVCNKFDDDMETYASSQGQEVMSDKTGGK
jgi:hypothetical protein